MTDSQPDTTPDYTKLPKIVFDRESIRIFVPQRRPTVYRLLGAQGQLVYGGASMQPRTRLLEHFRNGKPADLVALQFFTSSTAMARAEKLMIDNENPELDCGIPRRHASWNARKATILT